MSKLVLRIVGFGFLKFYLMSEFCYKPTHLISENSGS
jgi:hypothetical protein